MLNAASLIDYLQCLTLAGSVLTVLKLYWTDLYRRYRMFFLLFLFQIPNTLWPLFIDINSNAYFHVWRVTEPVTWLLYVLVVRELYRLVLEQHKGLYSLGRWMMYLAIVVAVFVSTLSLLPHFNPAKPQKSQLLPYFFAAERAIELSLAIFIFLILLFLSRYPVPLSRNVLVHTGLYSIYFLSGTVGMLLLNAKGIAANEKINLFFTGMSSVCAFAWFFLLTRKGEETQTTLPFYSAEYERRALEQLDAINATLLRVARK